MNKSSSNNGPYRCLAVHPTELYSSADAAFDRVLYLFWRRSRKAELVGTRRYNRSGLDICAYVYCLRVVRFFEEYLRDDNPFETVW